MFSCGFDVTIPNSVVSDFGKWARSDSEYPAKRPNVLPAYAGWIESALLYDLDSPPRFSRIKVQLLWATS